MTGTPQSETKSLFDHVDYFRVTDRAFETTLDFLNLDETYIRALPANARVLDIGAGLNQNLARGIKRLRPDILVASIDPSIILTDPSTVLTTHQNNPEFPTTPDTVAYHERKSVRPKDFHLYDSDEVLTKIAEQRLETAKKTGGVTAALAPYLPFANESFDLVADSFGPFIYINCQKEYLEEIKRVLKKGGEAKIYPLDNVKTNIFSRDRLKEEVNEKIKQMIEKITSEIPGIATPFYTKQDPGDNNNIRLGMSLKHKIADQG